MAAALAFSRQGLTVALQRPASPLKAGPDVRTYALNAASRELLGTLKVWPALGSDAVTAVHDMQVFGDAGASLVFSAYEQGVEALAWIVEAAALEQALQAALDFAAHVSVVTQAVDAGLLVLAEGRDSASRRALGVRYERSAYGQHAVAARLVADAPHGGLARQWFRSPEVLALLPFDRPQRGCSYGLVWSVEEARAQSLLQMAPEAFEQALADATGGAAGALRLDGERAAWPLALARAEPVCGSGWVLVGDAAHLVHPLAGQGLNLGLADVASLAATLQQRSPHERPGDLAVLRRHVRARAGATLAMGSVTDGLLQLFAHPSPLVRELRNRGLGLVGALPPLKRWLVTQAGRT